MFLAALILIVLGLFVFCAPLSVKFFLSNLIEDITKKNIVNYKTWTPLLLSYFLFFFFSNLVGICINSFTQSFIINFTLALLLWIIVLFYGIWEGKIAKAFWNKSIILPLRIVLCFIEIFSFILRPVILAIRLFANVFIGHMILDILQECSIFLVKTIPILIFIVTPILIITNIIEIITGFLQAYLFIIFSSLLISVIYNEEH